MIPSHHPHPETLVAYASGTLPNAVACVVACHLSMCGECAKEVRWLERLGGVMLSNIETDDVEGALAERIVAQSFFQRRHCEPLRKPMTKRDDPLLPQPLARFLGAKGAEIAWKPVGGGIEERSIELPKDCGSIRLLRLSAGERLPEQNFASETDVVLVLQGACRDGAGTYVRGDIIEWAQDASHRPMASGGAECVCMIADQAHPVSTAV
jgi:putative transcriptional regulator